MSFQKNNNFIKGYTDLLMDLRIFFSYFSFCSFQSFFNVSKYLHSTLPIAEILSGKNVRAFLVCGFLMKSFKKNILKIWNKSWEPFGSYLLNSTANPAHFHPNWAGLAVLFSRQLLNGSQVFFVCFNILIFIYFFQYKTIETHVRAFLTLNILAIGEYS